MDIVLVGLPGSGKSVIGRRLAQRHGADVHRPRRTDRVARRALDPGDLRRRGRGGLPSARARGGRRPGPGRSRHPTSGGSIATGGGAVVDPRNRWALYRGRLPVWLDGRPEVLAQRLRRSPHVRPLVSGRDPIGTIRDLAAAPRAVLRRGARSSNRASPRSAASSTRSSDACRRPVGRARATAPAAPGDDADRADRHRRRDRSSTRWPPSWTRLRAPRGRSSSANRARGRPSASEPRRALRDAGWTVEPVMLPQGEAAKRLARHRGGGERARRAAGRAIRAARRHRRRRARRCGRVPRRDVPARRSGSSRSRRRSSPRSTRRSAARPASTCPRARTSSARSTSRRRS